MYADDKVCLFNKKIKILICPITHLLHPDTL